MVVMSFFRRRISEPISKWPKLFRFLAVNMVLGIAIGVALSALLVLTNAGGLRELIAGDGHPYISLFAFQFLFALTFGGVGMAIGVMLLSRSKDYGRQDSEVDPDDDRPADGPPSHMW